MFILASLATRTFCASLCGIDDDQFEQRKKEMKEAYFMLRRRSTYNQSETGWRQTPPINEIFEEILITNQAPDEPKTQDDLIFWSDATKVPYKNVRKFGIVEENKSSVNAIIRKDSVMTSNINSFEEELNSIQTCKIIFWRASLDNSSFLTDIHHSIQANLKMVV